MRELQVDEEQTILIMALKKENAEAKVHLQSELLGLPVELPKGLLLVSVAGLLY